MIRASQLLHRIIIDLTTAEEMGQVSELLINPREHRLRGVTSTAGFLGRGSRRFTWSQVSSIGKDSLVVRADAPVGNPDEILIDAIPVANLELWTDVGDRVGKVVDFVLDGETGVISQYLFLPDAAPQSDAEEGALTLYGLGRASVISMGRRRMMVPEAAMGEATPVAGTVPSAARPSISLPRPPRPETLPRWNEAMGQTREVTDQVQERAQQVAEEAKNRLGKLFGDVKKRSRRLQGQLRETVSDLTADLPTRQSGDQRPMTTVDVDALEIWPDDDPEDGPPQA